MPWFNIAFNYDTAVYWPFVSVDDYGEAIVGPPVELAPPHGVRWDASSQVGTDANGNTVIFDASVVVDREIAERSRIWLGTLTDWYATGSAGVPNELMEVKSFKGTYDLKRRQVYRTLMLMRYRNKQSPG